MNKRIRKKWDKMLTIKYFLALKKKFPEMFKNYKFGDLHPSRIYRKRNW